MCGNDYVYENDESLNQTLSILDMRDKCDRIIGLLQCLQLVVDTPDMNLYNGKPHHDLFLVIEEEVKMVEKSLQEMQ